MKTTRLISAHFLAWLLATGLQAAEEAMSPQLRKKGEATQLIVDRKPFVMLAGELHNSSASGVEYMQQMWPHLTALGLNTILVPVSWELLEPTEGQFDFTYVDRDSNHDFGNKGKPRAFVEIRGRVLPGDGGRRWAGGRTGYGAARSAGTRTT